MKSELIFSLQEHYPKEKETFQKDKTTEGHKLHTSKQLAALPDMPSC